MTNAKEIICMTVQGPIPKKKFVNNIDNKETIKLSGIPIFKAIMRNIAVMGWIFGKKGKANTKRPTVLIAVKIASKAIR